MKQSSPPLIWVNSMRTAFVIFASCMGFQYCAYANTAIEPVPRADEGKDRKDGGPVKQHAEFKALAKRGNIDVLFLGDSITNHWRFKGKAVWNKYFATLNAANFGISSDRTQHVLWRLQNGEGEGFSPKAIVLLIGTNNTGLENNSTQPRNTTPEIIEGVTAVVGELRTRFPQAKILLLGIFPRRQKDNPQRAQIIEVNQSLAKLDDQAHIFYLDIGDRFLDANGDIPKSIMPDGTHLSEKGYAIWAEAINEPLTRLLK